MQVRVERMDLHFETTASGSVPVLHRFTAIPEAPRCPLLVGSAPALVQGDSFRNESSDHRQPKVGTFASPPNQRGCFRAAGQARLFVNGKPVVTRAGRLETCTDGLREISCSSATAALGKASVFVDGAPVLCGRPSNR